MKALVSIGMTLFIAACGGGQPVTLATTPTPKTEDVRLPDPPQAWTIPPISAEWFPQVTTGGTGAFALRDALKETDTLMLVRSQHMGNAAWYDKIFQMIKAASADIRILERTDTMLDKIMLERGEIPFRKTWEVGGTDVLGRPYMLPKEHPLKTDWLDTPTRLNGAQTIMVLDIVAPDDTQLRRMRDTRTGSCDALLAEFQTALTDGHAFFGALTDHVNSALAHSFGHHLTEALPFWTDELTEYRQHPSADADRKRCSDAYLRFLDGYRECITADCSRGPRLHPEQGIIGMELSEGAMIPSTCPAPMGRDYLKELVSLGKRSAEPVWRAVSQSWSNDMARLTFVQKLNATVYDFCAPRHRRFHANDISDIQRQLSHLVQRMGRDSIQGLFKHADGKEAVPGAGQVTVLARVVMPATELSRLHDDLSADMAAAHRCTDGKRRPVHVSLVNVGTSEVYFSTIVFEEQLFCEDLPPGTPPKTTK